jgi:phosphoesterase RecJ-like protein
MFFPQDSQIFKHYLNLIKNKKVVIVGHINPDGDSIGSQVGLCGILRSMGIEAVCSNMDEIPIKLKSFLANTPLIPPHEVNPEVYTCITVDCADSTRMGILKDKFPHPFLVIDHHISNVGYGMHNIIKPESAATAEIIAGMALDNGIKLDVDAAQALLLGITTDTGNFLFSSTTTQVFQITAQLTHYGANNNKICKELYQKESFMRLQLLQHFLASLRLELEEQVCIGTLSDTDYQSTGAHYEDSEGFVDYVRSLKQVNVGVILEQRGNKVKGSLRAKNSAIRVDVLAKEFQGGGHPVAAGFTIEADLKQFYPIFINSIQKHLKHYHSYVD